MKGKTIESDILLAMLLCLCSTCVWAELPDNCFVIEAATSSSVSFSSSNYLEYSTDNGASWSELGTTPVALQANGSLYVKAKEGVNSDNLGCSSFSITGSVTLSGDILTLLDAAAMGESAFKQLFMNCTGITSAIDLILPETVTASCYESMFQGCTSLTTAPVLNAKILAAYCYKNMFNGCTALTLVRCYAVDVTATGCYDSWLNGVASTGTFIYSFDSYAENNDIYDAWWFFKNNAPGGWTKSVFPENCFCITCNEGDSYVSFEVEKLKYSENEGISWTPLPVTGQGSPVHLTKGEKIYITCLMESGATIAGSSFSITGNVSLSGDISSLLNQSPAAAMKMEHIFQKLFYGCTGITSAKDLVLPAMKMVSLGYESMFQGCTNMVSAPTVLPATTLAPNCYESMFQGCTSLTEAPALPATTLTSYCYESMFQDCTSLNIAPVLPALTLAHCCYINMFWGCTSLVYIECWAILDSEEKDKINCNGWTTDVSKRGFFIHDPNVKWTLDVDIIGWRTDSIYQLDMTSCGWSSLCLPLNVKVYYNSASVYYVSDLTDTYATLTAIPPGQTIPANTAVLVQRDVGDAYFQLSSDEPVSIGTNYLKGTLKHTECEANSVFVLDINEGRSTAEAPVMSIFSGESIPPFKAYLPVSDVPSGSQPKMIFRNETGTDAIPDSRPGAPADLIFNLSGQQVGRSFKGIRIENGKKVLVK